MAQSELSYRVSCISDQDDLATGPFPSRCKLPDRIKVQLVNLSHDLGHKAIDSLPKPRLDFL